MCLPRSRRRQRQLPGQRRTGTTRLSLVAVMDALIRRADVARFFTLYTEPLPRDHSPEPRTRQLGDAQTRARPDISRAGAGMCNRDDGPAGSNIDRQRGAEGSNRGRHRGQVKPRSGRERARCSVAGMVSPSRVQGACTLHTLRTWGADIPAGVCMPLSRIDFSSKSADCGGTQGRLQVSRSDGKNCFCAKVVTGRQG